ncbi:hypothetical protein [Mesorhizobium sp. WSM4887]|uniref:hypothetical protein n=1 Tax=Mesorhizobium sp. WSM4887 TaxID=3038543 RepID=UPI0024163F45|nr:hypothetical protein [Mesorhizobium sp. WSM4887]MDG4889730.1 hypothetical protein [Mesorhizobium sp. WSM4887]
MKRKVPYSLSLLFLALATSDVGAQQTVSQVVSPIDVPASLAAEAADARTDITGVTRAIRLDPEELARTHLPVISIGTRNAAVRAAPYGVKSLGNSYVLNSTVDGSTLSLTGTRLKSEESGGADNPSFDQENKTEACRFTPLTEPDEIDEPGGGKEYAADCSWFRFGASYNLRLTCRGPSDTRCSEPEFLQSVAAAQVVVKGGE